MSPIGKVPVSNVSPAHDVLRADRHPLDPIFKPTSVALVGASERAGSVGRTVLWNLISSPFGGTIYPVNPKRSNILGIRAYASLRELPEVPDLVIVCTPAEGVPALLRECVELGVPGGIVISAGFKETGEHGTATGSRDHADHPGPDAHHRSQLPRRDESDSGPERDLCQLHGAARQRGLHQPERRALHGGAGLVDPARTSASAASSPSARCWM